MLSIISRSVKNTDDHLRNHGFLLREGGWELSPAYDMNANPSGQGLTLNISDDDNSLDPELALSVATFFRLAASDAEKILENMIRQVAQWRTIAGKHGMSRREQENMSPAFFGN